MRWLIQLVVELFRAIFETLVDHPYTEEKEYEDISEEGTHPDDPDDVFEPSDW